VQRNRVEAYSNRGLSCEVMGRRTDAIADFRKAQSIEPADLVSKQQLRVLGFQEAASSESICKRPGLIAKAAFRIEPDAPIPDTAPLTNCGSASPQRCLTEFGLVLAVINGALLSTVFINSRHHSAAGCRWFDRSPGLGGRRLPTSLRHPARRPVPRPRVAKVVGVDLRRDCRGNAGAVFRPGT
jgi:hypothetical protein